MKSMWNRTVSRAVAATAVAVMLGMLVVPSARAADTTPPVAPTGLTLTPSTNPNDGQLTLTWTGSTSGDVQGYRVYRWYGSGTPQVSERSFLAEAGTYLVDLLPVEGVYKYAVVAYDVAGNQSNPTTWSAYTYNTTTNGSTMAMDTTAPAKVTGLAAVDNFTTGTTAGLYWTPPASTNDLKRYLIYRATGNGSAVFLNYVSAGITSYVDADLTDNGYTYYLVAQDQAGNVSAASDSVSVTIDNVTPVVDITAPLADLNYRNQGKLVVTADVTENGSGYETSDFDIYVNGVEVTSPVLDLATLGTGFHHIMVRVTDRAGNQGGDDLFLTVAGAPAADAPTMLSASALTKSPTVTVNWSAPLQTTGLTSYTLYKTNPGGETSVVGAYGPSVFAASTTVSSDGTWSFYVKAQYGAVYGSPSASVLYTVDRIAPVITVTAPERGKAYEKTGSIVPAFTVIDAVSGTALSAAAELRLDGNLFTSGAIDLAALSEGTHRFSVKATDLAGNATTKNVTFTVGQATNPGDDDDDDDDDDDEDDDDDDDDDDDKPGNGNGNGRDPLLDLNFNVDEETQAAVIAELAQWQRLIQRGHYVSLMAKAKSGHMRNLVLHLIKHEGKHIPHGVVENVLEILDLEDLDIDPRSIPDSEIEGDWSVKPGNSKDKDRD